MRSVCAVRASSMRDRDRLRHIMHSRGYLVYIQGTHSICIRWCSSLFQEPSTEAGSGEENTASCGEDTPSEQPTEQEEGKDEIQLLLQEKEEKIKDFQVLIEMCVIALGCVSLHNSSP